MYFYVTLVVLFKRKLMRVNKFGCVVASCEELRRYKYFVLRYKELFSVCYLLVLRDLDLHIVPLGLGCSKMGNSFRAQPLPTRYPSMRTPVTEDTLQVGLLYAFGIIALCFILIIPGIRGWEVLQFLYACMHP